MNRTTLLAVCAALLSLTSVFAENLVSNASFEGLDEQWIEVHAVHADENNH